MLDLLNQSLQSMLYLAASRGLQVLVLTCTPADCIGFAAKETRLITPGKGKGGSVSIT